MESCGWSFHASDVSSPPSRGSDPAPLPPALGLEPLLPAGIEAAGVLSKAETLVLRAPLFEAFPDSSLSKESACNAEDPGLIPRSGRAPGEGIGYPRQYSGLENSMDYIIHGVAQSDTTERLITLNP